MELQRKIEKLIRDLVWERDDAFGAENVAKLILELPEIAEALRIKKDYDAARLGHTTSS